MVNLRHFPISEFHLFGPCPPDSAEALKTWYAVGDSASDSPTPAADCPPAIGRRPHGDDRRVASQFAQGDHVEPLSGLDGWRQPVLREPGPRLAALGRAGTVAFLKPSQKEWARTSRN